MSAFIGIVLLIASFFCALVTGAAIESGRVMKNRNTERGAVLFMLVGIALVIFGILLLGWG